MPDSLDRRALVVAIEGWLLGSGQHAPIAVGQQLRFAVEVSTDPDWERVYPNDSNRLDPSLEPCGGRGYTAVARVLVVLERVTVLDVGVPVFMAGQPHLNAPQLRIGDVLTGQLTLCVDPYVGRRDRRRDGLSVELKREWVVDAIRRQDAAGVTVVTSTEPASSSALYLLTVRPATTAG